MTGAVAVENPRRLGRTLSGLAIPATVVGVHDLRQGQLAALKVVTSDVDEPVDMDTVVRTLRAMAGAHSSRHLLDPFRPLGLETIRR